VSAPSPLRRPVGVRPTGPDGTWTRRDHLRAAGWNALWTALCAGVVWLDQDHFGAPGVVGIVAMFAFVFALGAMVLRLIGVVTGWRRYMQGETLKLR
jgi:apolipoprotein N-acyltransferase